MSSLRLLQLNFFLVLACLGMLFGQSLHAAEKAKLRLNGKDLDSIGKNSCSSSEKIEIVLADTITNIYKDFRISRRSLAKVDDTKSPCLSDITTGEVIADFTKDTPSIEQKHLLDAGACGSDGSKGTNYLCIYPSVSGGTKLLAEVKYTYSTKQAKITKISEKNAANSKVSFKVDYEGDNVESIETCYIKTSTGDIASADCTSGTNKSSPPNVIIKDLENGEEYAFKARLLLSGGGESAWFDSFELKPIPVAYSSYNGQGSELSCQNSQAKSFYFFALVFISLLILRFRKKIKYYNIIILFMMFFIPTKFSHADFGQVNVGLLGSPYRPDLDSEKLSSGDNIFPFYKCQFRKKTSQDKGPIVPLIGAEADLHLWDGFGSLQLGLGLGYTFVSGQALGIDNDNIPICDEPVDGTKIKLHMYQIRPQLTYLFSPFAEIVPLVPYIRGAVIGHGYSFTEEGKSSPTTVNSEGVTIKPNGFRFGYQAAVGLMLMLDFLEPGTVRSASGEGMFNHVYLKGELSYTKIDSFGKKGYQFSANDIMGSKLPLLWTFGLVFELP